MNFDELTVFVKTRVQSREWDEKTSTLTVELQSPRDKETLLSLWCFVTCMPTGTEKPSECMCALRTLAANEDVATRTLLFWVPLELKNPKSLLLFSMEKKDGEPVPHNAECYTLPLA